MNNEPRFVCVRAPAKLILSGEHAVVYGAPALAMSLDLYTTSTLCEQALPTVFFDLPDVDYRGALSLAELQSLLGLSRVGHPAQLSQRAVAEGLQDLDSGLHVHVSSDVPVGAGLGSSASTITSLLHALRDYHEANLDQDALISLANDIEQLQHGRASGLDVALATRGGFGRFESGELQDRPTPRCTFTFVNTGIPLADTGECIAAATLYFKDGSLVRAFGEVTDRLDQALAANDLDGITQAIRDNHELLKLIGVVPGKVADFIKHIETLGGAAKTCGAGSVRGQAAGIVCVVGAVDVSFLCEAYGFEIIEANIEAEGVHRV